MCCKLQHAKVLNEILPIIMQYFKGYFKNIGFRNVNLAYLSKINQFNTILKNKEKLYIPLDKKY